MTLAIALLIGLVLAVLAIPRIVALWRGRRSDDWVRVISVFLGMALARGVVRALPILYLIMVASVVFVIAKPVFESSLPTLTRPITVLFALSYVAVWLVVLSVVAVNRPSLVVPPHLRSQPGAISEWFGRPRDGSHR